MRQYHKLLSNILIKGNEKTDRTGTGTLSLFGSQMRFNLGDGFPLVTTKKVPIRLIVEELLWFLRGETNIKTLVEKNVHIWDEWADSNGELGPVYGKQWRSWACPDGSATDQISALIARIKAKPDDRRLIVSAWNVADIDKMKLPPCHCFFQFYVHDGKISCQLYQRSADMFLGVPFNIASYALLLMMVGQVTNLVPHEFIHTFGDAHIYKNHREQVRLLLSRQPMALPIMKINPEIKDIFSFKAEDFKLVDYVPYPKIDAPVAV